MIAVLLYFAACFLLGLVTAALESDDAINTPHR